MPFARACLCVVAVSVSLSAGAGATQAQDSSQAAPLELPRTTAGAGEGSLVPPAPGGQRQPGYRPAPPRRTTDTTTPDQWQLKPLGDLPDYLPAPAEPAAGPAVTRDGGTSVSRPEATADPSSEQAREAARVEAEPKPGFRVQDLMDTDTVVALVDGEPVLWGQVWRSLQDLPESYQDQAESLFPPLLRRTIDLRLLAAHGRDLGLAEDEALRQRVQDFENDQIRELVLARQIEGQVTEEALREAYADYVQKHMSGLEVAARHILLDNRTTAREIIEALDGGADFAALAREHSLGPSAELGGDLGTFKLSRMVPEFAKAVARLPSGQYTREPVKTEFGWHVILLEERVTPRPESFADAEPRLRAELSQRAVHALLRKLWADADIDILPSEVGANSGAGNEGN